MSDWDDTEDPYLLAVIDKWDLPDDNAPLIIRGRIAAMTVRTDVKRSGLGGDNYDSDSFTGYAKLEPENLSCDFIIRRPKLLIKEADGELGIVGEVLGQLGREIGLQTYLCMVEHGKRVYALKDNLPQRVSRKGRAEQALTVDDVKPNSQVL